MQDSSIFDLQGRRQFKYETLNNSKFNQIQWAELKHSSPYRFFVPKNFESIEEYDSGFALNELFCNYNSGIQTKSDDICVHSNRQDLENVLMDFESQTVESLKIKYHHKKDSSGWNFNTAKASLRKGYLLTKINYRPFDDRLTAYTTNSGGFIGRPRTETMKHIIEKDNISLITCRQQSSFNFQHIFLTKSVTDLNSISLQTKEQSYIFPLYIYHSKNDGALLKGNERTPNLNEEIIRKIASNLELTFVNETTAKTSQDLFNLFAPIDVLDYIYAMLHSTRYREKYKEFLKIDFPKLQYPNRPDIFWELVKKGGDLRQTHLLESSNSDKLITQYPVDGDNIVTKIKFEENYEIINGDSITQIDAVYPMGRVYINETQYFQMVPEVAWNFYIGGYQPAQKWLKDRKGRELNFEDILHYQKIIVALKRTDELMKEIDLIA